MSKIYTHSGDKGQTSLAGGKRVAKTHVRLEAYGTVDELSSHIGMLCAMLTDQHDRNFVCSIQQTLFNLSALLATERFNRPCSIFRQSWQPNQNPRGGHSHLPQMQSERWNKRLTPSKTDCLNSGLSYCLADAQQQPRRTYAARYVAEPNAASMLWQKSSP